MYKHDEVVDRKEILLYAIGMNSYSYSWQKLKAITSEEGSATSTYLWYSGAHQFYNLCQENAVNH